MPDVFNLTDDMQRYFNFLPKGIQEELIQSGAKVSSLTEMKQVVDTITQKPDELEQG